MTGSLIRGCFRIAALLAVVAWADASPAQSTLLHNAGFEQKEDHDQPADWQASPQVYSVDHDHVHSGKSALRYHNEDAEQYKLCKQKLALRHDRTYQLSGWVRTKNVQGKGAQLAIEWYDKKGDYIAGDYARPVKPTHWMKIKTGFVTLPPDAATARVVCYVHRKGTGTAWFDDLKLTARPRPVLRKPVLVRPNYRGRMTVGGKPIALTGSVARQAKLSGEAVATLTDASGNVLQSAREAVSSGQRFTLHVPIEGCEPGRYTLTLQLQRGGGGILNIRSYPIHVMAASAPKPRVYIDAHNRLMIQGKPVVPIGVYMGKASADDLKLLHDSAFNCAMPYHMPTRDMLDRAQKAGIYLFASIKRLYFGSGHTPPRIKSRADEQPAVRSYLRKLRDQPALLGWYTNDELGTQFVAQLNEHYQWVKELDPDHPVWQVLNKPHKVGRYLHGFDAIGTDPYPLLRRPISSVGDWTQTTIDQVDDARPVWEVIQAHNLRNYGRKKGRTPRPEELRNMIWQALTHGANGIVLYSFFDLKRNPDRPFKTNWPNVKTIAGEVAAWAPVLLSIDPSPEVTVAASSTPSWLSFRVQTWHGRTFVFAVNNTRQAHEARFHVNDSIDHVRVIGEKGRKIAASQNAWRDSFKPLALHIYELDGSGAPLPEPQHVPPPAAEASKAASKRDAAAPRRP